MSYELPLVVGLGLARLRVLHQTPRRHCHGFPVRRRSAACRVRSDPARGPAPAPKPSASAGSCCREPPRAGLSRHLPPAAAPGRVLLNAARQAELRLKAPWRDGTTHLLLSPLEFMQRLAAWVLRPSLGRTGPPGSCRSRMTPDGRLLFRAATTAQACPARQVRRCAP